MRISCGVSSEATKAWYNSERFFSDQAEFVFATQVGKRPHHAHTGYQLIDFFPGAFDDLFWRAHLGRRFNQQRRHDTFYVDAKVCQDLGGRNGLIAHDPRVTDRPLCEGGFGQRDGTLFPPAQRFAGQRIV